MYSGSAALSYSSGNGQSGTEEDEHFSTPQSNPRLCGRNSANTEAFHVAVLVPQPKMLSRRRSGHILPNFKQVVL